MNIRSNDVIKFVNEQVSLKDLLVYIQNIYIYSKFIYIILYNIYKMKILNLVLYSDSDHYREMKKITSEYYSNFDYVKTIYYQYSNINDNMVIGDNLYLKGTESYIPGILNKTITAFEFFTGSNSNAESDYKYDYLVRTNISTIFNFNILISYLKCNYIDYGGTCELEYLINNNKIRYSSGTSIIFSYNTIQYIVKHKDKINYEYIDDVAIGYFINNYLSDIKIKYISSLIWTPNFSVSNENEDPNPKFIKFLHDNSNAIAFRNHNGNRHIDILQMKIISDYYKQYINSYSVIGKEGESILLDDNTIVRYGAHGKYIEKYFLKDTTIFLTNNFFGNDPYPNVIKHGEKPIKSNNLINTLSIGAVFKNESHILKEWIDHHLYHGVDHIYLVNDYSTNGYAEILLPYIELGYVTLYENDLVINTYPRQKFIYDKYFKPILNQSEWFLIIDLDEFIYSSKYIDIKLTLKDYQIYSQVNILWSMFGSSGYINQPDNVVASFIKRKKDKIGMGKSIFKTSKLINFDVHIHEVEGITITDESNNLIINHYAIQSWDFFSKIKMTRGDVNNYANVCGIVRNRDYFNNYDYNEMEDYQLAIQNGN